MKKVYIVDDERLILEGMRCIIDWSAHGMCLAGTAEDGQVALREIRELRPDLIFTDIRMPGMNGFDLIREARKLVPGAVFVIISGYNDFNYIRMALRLCVFDYLDKPVTVEKIEEVLAHYAQLYREEPLGPASDAQWQEALEAVLREPNMLENQLILLQSRCGVNLTSPHPFAVLNLRADTAEALPAALTGLRAACEGQGWRCAARVCGAEASMILLAQGGEFRLETARDLFSPLAGGGVRISMSRSFMNIREISRAVTSSANAMEYAAFLEEDFLIAGDQRTEDHIRDDFLNVDREIVYAMRVGDREKALEQVGEALDTLITCSVSVDIFQHECLRILQLGLQILEEAGQRAPFSSDAFAADLVSCHRAKDAARLVMEKFEWLLDMLEDSRVTEGQRGIERARAYIDAHCAEPLTLEGIAEVAGLYPTYFSMLFKEVVGVNYVKYLNGVRMERAKELLKSTMPLKDICVLCGFPNLRYFTDRFKQYYGCTPTQMRGNNR